MVMENHRAYWKIGFEYSEKNWTFGKDWTVWNFDIGYLKVLYD